MRSFNVRCPSCSTEFPVDPKKVPAGGVAAICSECDRVFNVELPKAEPKPTDVSTPEEVVTSPGPLSDLLGSDEPQISLGPVSEIEVEEAADEPADAPPPPTKKSIPSPRAQPPFEDLSSLADDALSSSEPDAPARAVSMDAAKQKFGRRDPHERAQHLARVLVSDIIAYYPVRYQESLARGTLKEDFGKEVEKSWKEYIDQVGIEMAESTPYFNEALNEVLARGKDVF